MLGFKYVRVLNIPALSICPGSEFPGLHRVYLIWKIWEGSEYACICFDELFWIWQGSEYSWPMFHKVLNMPLVLNMPVLGIIWQGHEYARTTQCAEYDKISLNIP